MIPTAQTASPDALAPSQVAAIAALWFTVWPRDHDDLQARIENFHARTIERPDRVLHHVFEGGQVLAVAESFSRTVHTPTGILTVMALASVCTHPSSRGQGYGRKVVQSAFARVDRGEFPVALFQTGVPRFYEALGARPVTNVFTNQLDPKNPGRNPFWDEHLMIYPASAAWSEGPIDLNGPGY